METYTAVIGMGIDRDVRDVVNALFERFSGSVPLGTFHHNLARELPYDQVIPKVTDPRSIAELRDALELGVVLYNLENGHVVRS